jgi:hypothetical protein
MRFFGKNFGYRKTYPARPGSIGRATGGRIARLEPGRLLDFPRECDGGALRAGQGAAAQAVVIPRQADATPPCAQCAPSRRTVGYGRIERRHPAIRKRERTTEKAFPFDVDQIYRPATSPRIAKNALYYLLK